MAEYDDAFKTVVHRCRELLIPLVNEAFGEHFSRSAIVEYGNKEYVLDEPEGEQEKRYSDAVFRIKEGRESKKFHWECQAKGDSTMLVRMHDYDMSIALEDREILPGKMRLRLPRSAVLYLRDDRSIPETMEIEYEEDGKVSFTHEIKVMKLQSYSLEEIFEKDLLALLPFYIFHYQGKLGKIAESADGMEALGRVFQSMERGIIEKQDEGKITALSRIILEEMAENVAKKFAAKYKNVQEEVQKVMGGKVIQTEGGKIYDEGKREGKQEGKEEGKKLGEERLGKLFQQLMKLGRNEDAMLASADRDARETLYREFGIA